MIEIDFSNETYTCPFCNCKQAFAKSSYYVDTHLMNSSYLDCVPELYRPSTFRIYSLVCCNSDCCKVSVVAVNRFTKKQVDVFPQYAFRHYPDYIPEQIRNEAEQTVKACLKYNCPCDITLKDISTVGDRPENLIVWSAVVSDVLDEYYGKE